MLAEDEERWNVGCWARDMEPLWLALLMVPDRFMAGRGCENPKLRLGPPKVCAKC
jgi:hypothetical protein